MPSKADWQAAWALAKLNGNIIEPRAILCYDDAWFADKGDAQYGPFVKLAPRLWTDRRPTARVWVWQSQTDKTLKAVGWHTMQEYVTQIRARKSSPQPRRRSEHESI